MSYEDTAPYIRGTRPQLPESDRVYVDRELQKIEGAVRKLNSAIENSGGGGGGASTVAALTDATDAFKALNVTDAAAQRAVLGAAAVSDLNGKLDTSALPSKLSSLAAGTAAAPQLAPQASPGSGLLLINSGVYYATGGLTPFYVLPDRLVYIPNGTNKRFSISDNVAQLPHDNIVMGNDGADLNVAKRYFPPNITWKRPDYEATKVNGGFELPFLSITCQDAVNAGNFGGTAGANFQAGWGLPLNFFTNSSGWTTYPDGHRVYNDSLRLQITGGADVGVVQTYASDFIVSRTAPGSVLSRFIVRATNTTSGKVSEGKFAVQDNNLGTLRFLIYAPGPLNAGAPNQGRMDLCVEDGSLLISSTQSTAAAGGSLFSLYDRSGTALLQLNAYAGGSITINGNKVLGPRQTGWSAMTGTATKGGGDTSTVTLQQLAQVVKALVDTLTTHGLIGP
jgi:hypothetical protein